MTAEARATSSAPKGSGDRITTHPLIGVLAVLLGTINSVLSYRLLVIALPDLRGVLGIGIDEATWIPTALSAAQMFMGPMSIVLAAIFGHRRVLLVSSVIFMLSSLASPLVPDWRVLIFFQVIRGLSSGTFYPLALSFVTRSLPTPWISFGLAAYALDVLGTNHLAFPLYAFYSEHASWHWLFWNSLIFTGAMMICIYRGMPIQKPLQDYHKMRYRDFLYGSAGLTLLYIGFDQGERCDWFNSGLINGLFVSGTILLLCALYRRLITPNPLFDFRLLKTRNFLLLAYLLTVYRVSLLGSFGLIPDFLITLHSYRPPEVASLALYSGVGAVLVGPLVAVAVNRFDTRLLTAVGFAIVSLGLFGQAHILSTWLKHDFTFWQIVTAIGHPIAFIPLVTIQLLSNTEPGQPPSRVLAYTTGAYFQTIRLFFTEAGSSVMQRFLLTREHFWRTILVSHVNGDWQTNERLLTLTGAMVPNAPGIAPASGRALELLTGAVLRQAKTLAQADGFMVLGCFVVSGLFLIALLRPTWSLGQQTKP